MRNILEKPRKCDYDEIKAGARPSTEPKVDLRLKVRSADSAPAGNAPIPAW